MLRLAGAFVHRVSGGSPPRQKDNIRRDIGAVNPYETLCREYMI
jgi:hypothetical protein